MTDTANAPERIKAWMQPYFSEIGSWSTTRYPEVTIEYVLAAHCDELVEVARAEGAREAQAKIARLTEALDEKQDGGRNFWMKWTQKRLEINRAMFLRDAKLALAGDMRALRNRVELMEAEPVPIVLSLALQENANG